MYNSYVKLWSEIDREEKLSVFGEVSKNTGLPVAAVEKNWWVVRTLEMVFGMDAGAHMVFKGGTSLSKAWGLIDRLSEDIDLALDRKFLGFGESMTPSQVKKLREHSWKRYSFYTKSFKSLQTK